MSFRYFFRISGFMNEILNRLPIPVYRSEDSKFLKFLFNRFF